VRGGLTARRRVSSVISMADHDLSLMRLALAQAQAAADRGEIPVGAVVADPATGAVIAAAANAPIALKDPTAHAEMVVIRRLSAKLKSETLEGYTLYCTLQPCGMCTMACLWAGISRIVFGAGRNDVSAEYFESRHNDTVDFIRDAFRSDLQIEGEILAAECSSLYAKQEEPSSLESDPAHATTKPPK